MDSADTISDLFWKTAYAFSTVPLWTWVVGSALAILISLIPLYIILYFLAPIPRPPRPAEKQYFTLTHDGKVSAPTPLPCWYDECAARKELAKRQGGATEDAYNIADPECLMTLVIPAYNEEERLPEMLQEAIEYLQQQYGEDVMRANGSSNGSLKSSSSPKGWEVVLVSDGSTDKTVATALHFVKTYSPRQSTKGSSHSGSIKPGQVRVVQLEENRGKGGAVTHGMRHARGLYVVFADADGASRFADLGKLVEACDKAKDNKGRAVGVGSRAHMVGTDAVVKRSLLRNFLMRGFHLLIWTLTTSRTSHIKDTQCGFKLFTRASLPYIIPFMHSEGWIFDVEMLLLAESADIPMVEVPIGWKEVMGSKLNVIKDSIGMAFGLALLRVCWGIGIYKRD